MTSKYFSIGSVRPPLRTIDPRAVQADGAFGHVVDADQQAEYPGDRFFEFVPALQEAEIRLPVS